MMKKKGDITKLSKEGKIDYLIGKILNRIFILSFFLFIDQSAQTLLNNFGISDFIKTHSRYSRFSFIDYNNDNRNDLFLYGNQEKSFVIHKGLKDSTYSPPTRKFFFYPIDDFKWLTKSAAGDDYYIFVSRNRRLVGLVSFTKSYSLQLLNTIVFDSYPSSIKITDFNQDGKNEALVYGNNFNGIVLVQNEGYRLNSQKLFEQSLFNDVVLVDINQDDFEDIVLIDVLNNSLKFLENSESSEFILNREMGKAEPIYCLKKIDIHNDSFVDLALGTERGIEILEGDSVYSFSSSFLYENNFPVENFIFADFNSDESPDLAVMNRLENKLEIQFNGNNDYQSVKYAFDGISDFDLTPEKNRNSITALSTKGKIQIFSSENKYGENFSFSAGGSPDKLIVTKSDQNKFPFILYSNLMENSVDLLTLDSLGNILKSNHYQFLNNISEFRFAQNLDVLIGYNKKSRLLEFIYTDENIENSNKQNYIYTDYPIEQLFIDRENRIQILESDGQILYQRTLLIEDGEIPATKSNLIDSAAVSSYMSRGGEIYFWRKEEFELVLSSTGNKISDSILAITNADSLKYDPIIIGMENSTKDLLFTIYQTDEIPKIFVIQNNKPTEYKLSDSNIDWKKYYIKIFENGKGEVNLYCYDKAKSEFKIFSLNSNKNILVPMNTVEGIVLNDYFVTQFLGKLYLVYTNSNNNCLTFNTLN